MWHGTGRGSFAGNGPLTRYVRLWVAHAPGMPGKFSLPPWFRCLPPFLRLTKQAGTPGFLARQDSAERALVGQRGARFSEPVRSRLNPTWWDTHTIIRRHETVDLILNSRYLGHARLMITLPTELWSNNLENKLGYNRDFLHYIII